jgi:hypothetical protein
MKPEYLLLSSQETLPFIMHFPEDGDHKFLRNVDNYLQVYRAGAVKQKITIYNFSLCYHRIGDNISTH